MKHVILFICTVLLSVNLFSQSGNVKQNTTEPEIVVNKAMIEKFNNYEYSTKQISFYDVFRNYSFDDVKLIMNGYQKDELKLSSEEEINGFLSQTRQEMVDGEYSQISENIKTTTDDNSL